MQPFLRPTCASMTRSQVMNRRSRSSVRSSFGMSFQRYHFASPALVTARLPAIGGFYGEEPREPPRLPRRDARARGRARGRRPPLGLRGGPTAELFVLEAHPLQDRPPDALAGGEPVPVVEGEVDPGVEPGDRRFGGGFVEGRERARGQGRRQAVGSAHG